MKTIHLFLISLFCWLANSNQNSEKCVNLELAFQSAAQDNEEVSDFLTNFEFIFLILGSMPLYAEGIWT